MVKKYEAFAGTDEVDIDELRDVLTELNSGRPPMLRDLMWAMSVGDRDGGGTLSKHELRGILGKFRIHMKSAGGIVSLVEKYASGKAELSDDNMRLLMAEVTGAPADVITADDVKRVRQLGGDHKEVLANLNLMDKSGSSSTHLVHVDYLAKAIDRVRAIVLTQITMLLRRAPATSNALTEPARAPVHRAVGPRAKFGDRADESAQGAESVRGCCCCRRQADSTADR